MVLSFAHAGMLIQAVRSSSQMLHPIVSNCVNVRMLHPVNSFVVSNECGDAGHVLKI